MKTLDEVIKALEEIVSLTNGESESEGYFLALDSLHYLKAYRDDKDEIDSTRLAYLDVLTDYVALKQYWTEQQVNPPLTWEQLKSMVGKPVWVEVDEKWWGRFWAFVEVESDSYINFFQKGQEYPEDLWKSNMGKTWNAFRKERE